MAGPGTVSGASGERDGRLDLFLERGDYKIVTHGHEKASGTVHLEAHPFSEKNAPQPSLLVVFRYFEMKIEKRNREYTWVDIFTKVMGRDPFTCPKCKTGRLSERYTGRAGGFRDPPRD